MNYDQANKIFEQLKADVKKVMETVPFKVVEKINNNAANLKEKMEETISKLESKDELNDAQEMTLDRFQSSIEAMSEIARILEQLQDAVEEFSKVQRHIDEADNTM